MINLNSSSISKFHKSLSKTVPVFFIHTLFQKLIPAQKTLKTEMLFLENLVKEIKLRKNYYYY